MQRYTRACVCMLKRVCRHIVPLRVAKCMQAPRIVHECIKTELACKYLSTHICSLVHATKYTYVFANM